MRWEGLIRRFETNVETGFGGEAVLFETRWLLLGFELYMVDCTSEMYIVITTMSWRVRGTSRIAPAAGRVGETGSYVAGRVTVAPGLYKQ